VANSYLRFPNNFFMGTRTLTLEERGAYNDLLDLYIARDGDLPDMPRQRAHDLAIDQRVWNRIRKKLIGAGKIEVKDGVILPTGGDRTLARCLARSLAAREAADSRWRKNGSKVPILNETLDADADASAMRTIKTRHKSNNLAKKSISLKKQFEEWYEHYPRKVGRGAAEKQYKTALKKTDQETLVAAILKFAMAVADKDKNFIPHPATWLSQERWSDDQTAINPNKPQKQPGDRSGNPSIASAARRFIAGERL